MLKLNNISKRYGKEQGLYPFSGSVEQGQTTVVIGPSGCGKSTLLRLVTGLLQPDSGEILIDGELLSTLTLPALRLRLGYVIQEGGLFPHMTAKANISIMAKFLNWEEPRIDARIGELLDLVQLSDDYLSRYPAELSGGQRQRISLMRALMLDPDLLLMDEPLGALDPMIRFDLQNDLKKIFARLNKSVLMVTHDIGEAAFFGDELILLKQGKVVQRGTISDLTHKPADEFVTCFINAQRHKFEDNEAVAE
ncbi:MAG: ATP-binding cassette domain-containing protein [Gammaproteobacteria bacterium]|nr:ATP-binding cassette domain-containing protein [Gammaproteobacteria bacterium]